MDTTALTETTTQLPDIEIIEKTLAGDKNAFGELIRKYNARLYRVGMAIINNESEIEDAMQNAYIKAYQNLHKFEHRALFSTWLIKILVNECLQSVKKKKRYMRLDGINSTPPQRSGNLYPEPRNPANIAMNNELGKALEHCLFELPEKYRVVFVMREMEDMSTAETMESLELSESNVKVRLNRAKAMLRTNLNEYYRSDTILKFYLTRCNRVLEHVMARI